jgi:hypothetical protein
VRLFGSVVECLGHFSIGSEGLTLFDPQRPQRVDQGAVAFQPRLVLDNSIQRFKETNVIGNGRIV